MKKKTTIGRRPSTTLSIKTYYCSFCHILVKKSEATNVRTKNGRYQRFCPKCGGTLYGDTPGVNRRIFTTR